MHQAISSGAIGRKSTSRCTVSYTRLGFILPLVLAGFYEFMTERIPSLAFGDPLGARAFPRLIVAGLVLSAVLWVFEDRVTAKLPDVFTEHTEGNHFTAVLAVAACTLAYVLALVPVGYVISTLLFLLVLTNHFNKGKWVANIATSVLFPVTSYVLFTKLLGVPLPYGDLLPL
jgi:putative tricarboxylic transport membrane protein